MEREYLCCLWRIVPFQCSSSSGKYLVDPRGFVPLTTMNEILTSAGRFPSSTAGLTARCQSYDGGHLYPYTAL